MTELNVALILKLVDQVTGPLKRVGAAIGDVAGRAARFDYRGQAEAIEAQNRAMLGSAIATAGMAYSFRRALQPAIEMEEAMAEVKKTVGFGSTEEMKGFQREIVAMSGRLPVAATALASIAADAGQAGFALEELLPWTEMTARNAVALGMSAEQAGDAFATIRTSMGLTLDQTQALADATNYLSNSMASKAPEIVEVLNRIGGSARQFGLAETEVAAFASAMLATGQPAEVVSTSIANMGRALTRGESATNRMTGAMGRLGLDTVDVAKGMQADAVGTIMDVLDRINAMPKEMQAALSSDIFGDEARALTPLISNVELLQKALGLVDEPAEFAGSALQEYGVRAATTANNIELMQNMLTRVQLSLEALLPAVNQVVSAVTPMIDRLAAWAEANPEAVAALGELTAGLIALKGASLAVRFVFGGMAARALRLVGGFRDVVAVAGTIAKVSLPLIGAAIKTLGRVLIANPLTAILGLGALAYEIYENWDQIAAWFEKLWNRVVAAFETAWSYIQPIVDHVSKGAQTIINALPSWLGGGDGEAPEARAAGGPVRRGGLYLVGEEGPELFRAGASGSILSAARTAAALAGAASMAAPLAAEPLRLDARPALTSPAQAAGGAGGGLTIGAIHIHPAPGADPAAIAREVRRQLAEMARGAGALHDGPNTGGRGW